MVMACRPHPWISTTSRPEQRRSRRRQYSARFAWTRFCRTRQCGSARFAATSFTIRRTAREAGFACASRARPAGPWPGHRPTSRLPPTRSEPSTCPWRAGHVRAGPCPRTRPRVGSLAGRRRRPLELPPRCLTSPLLGSRLQAKDGRSCRAPRSSRSVASPPAFPRTAARRGCPCRRARRSSAARDPAQTQASGLAAAALLDRPTPPRRPPLAAWQRRWRWAWRRRRRGPRRRYRGRGRCLRGKVQDRGLLLPVWPLWAARVPECELLRASLSDATLGLHICCAVKRVRSALAAQLSEFASSGMLACEASSVVACTCSMLLECAGQAQASQLAGARHRCRASVRIRTAR
mmetsp:Transcript_57865/g.188085  ORF Transcript_57865/g.188085 Transcript_57865/m.188085 type:complete len:349 (+) Transcript_57865:3481-4527(+)